MSRWVQAFGTAARGFICGRCHKPVEAEDRIRYRLVRATEIGSMSPYGTVSQHRIEHLACLWEKGWEVPPFPRVRAARVRAARAVGR